MRDLIPILTLVALGAGIGYWLRGRAPTTRKRLFQIVGIVVGAPVVLFVIALGLQSDTLAVVAGISMMAILAALLPLGIGALIGAYFAPPRDGARDSATSARPSASARAAKPTPAVAPRAPLSAQQQALIVVIAGVGAAVWVALTLAFRFNEDYVPEELERGFIPAAVVLIATVFLGLRAAWRKRSAIRAYEQRDLVAEHNAFLTEMAPKYDLDPHATACCEHLAPIESAMRAGGVRLQLAGPSAVTAQCCVDADALARKFALPENVSYQEWYARDRSAEDPPASLVYCATCPSKVWVLHATERRADTPTFP